MKMLIVLFSIVLGSLAMAADEAQTEKDIQSLLANPAIINAIGSAQISSITPLENRVYSIVFGDCVAQAQVTSICAPSLGGPCTNEVHFDSSSVICLP